MQKKAKIKKENKGKKENPKKIEEEIIKIIEEMQKTKAKEEKPKEAKEKKLEDSLKKEEKSKKDDRHIPNEIYFQVRRITPNYTQGNFYNFSSDGISYDELYKHMGQEKKDPYKAYLESLRSSFLDNVGSKDPISAEEVERIIKKNTAMYMLSNIADMPSEDEKERYKHWVMFNRYMNMIKIQLSGLGEHGASYLQHV